MPSLRETATLCLANLSGSASATLGDYQDAHLLDRLRRSVSVRNTLIKLPIEIEYP